MPLNNHWRNIPLKYGYDVEGSDDDYSDTFTHRKERHVALTKHLESLHDSSQHSEKAMTDDFKVSDTAAHRNSLEDHGWRLTGALKDGTGVYGHKSHEGHAIHVTRKGRWNHFSSGGKTVNNQGDGHESLGSHLKSFHTSQHSEEEVEPGHVTPERARELVAQTPGGHIVRRY